MNKKKYIFIDCSLFEQNVLNTMFGMPTDSIKSFYAIDSIQFSIHHMNWTDT